MPGTARDEKPTDTAAQAPSLLPSWDSPVNEPTTEADSCEHGAGSDAVAFNPPARFWLGVVVGAIITAPLAWLLAHAATLPFFIGLFFFALFGLMIGAAVHRVAAPGRPYARPTVIIGTSLLIVGGWVLSVFVEARDLPMDLAGSLPDRTLDLGGRTRTEYIDYIAAGIRSHLRGKYASDGAVGYLRWVVSSGEIPDGAIGGLNRTLRVPQRKGWWVMRALLSIALFAFGVSSQTFLLRLSRDPAAVRASELADAPPSTS